MTTAKVPLLAVADAAPGAAIPSVVPGAVVADPTSQAASPWPDAALHTLAQARRLWSAGARDAAANLLAEALLVLERSHGAELAEQARSLGAVRPKVLAYLQQLGVPLRER